MAGDSIKGGGCYIWPVINGIGAWESPSACDQLPVLPLISR